MDKIPKPGEFYRHFKNRMYQILAVAIHSETGERMVVYQALYGDFSVYVRPLSMFMEPVDKEKYPDAGQILRFEQVVPGESGFTPEQVSAAQGRDEEIPNSLLMDFLDAEHIEEQIGILQQMKGCASKRDVESLYLSQDMRMNEGTIEEQVEDFIQCLRMQQKYEASRLRRG